MLYICATPIGNLDDITLRVIKTLESADLILAEDTRHTQKLLNHLSIKTKTTSYHQHNFRSKGEYALEMLNNGANLALVTDAGMPAISDPGEHLVKLCIENNIEFTVLPGATAFVTALIASGLPTENFTFIGFLPYKTGQRKKKLESVKSISSTLVFYESPHRIIKMLTDTLEVLGDRKCALARELTKIHEEILRENISELLTHFDSISPKGEMVVVVKGAD